MALADLRMYVFAFALLPAAITAQNSPTSYPASSSTDAGQASDKDQQWYDTSHTFLTNKADGAARWMDGFFGEEQSDVETASSRVRLRFEYEWDEENGSDLKANLRGKLHLPAGANRLSLVFESEERDDSINAEDFESATFNTDEDRSVALQYNLWNKVRQRIDVSVGLKSGPKGKLSARYRYQYPLSDRYLLRFTEEVFWVGGDGFGNFTRTDIDRVFEHDQLLRWSNRALYSEDSNGVEWKSRVTFRHRLGERAALGYFASMKGETDPENVTRSYNLGVTFRRNFLRRWLFFEVEPSYQWRKGREDTRRKGAAVLLLRLEVALESRRSE